MEHDRRLPRTFWIGLLIVLACEALLFADVYFSGRGALHTHAEIAALKAEHKPATRLQRLARRVAVNMTPLVWVGYLLLVEGVLTRQRGRSPVRSRPHHFAMLCLASVIIWCIFDWINFYSIQAWRYIGMPEAFADRALGYLIAFGTIVPGMLMSGQVMMNAGVFDWARGRPWRLPGWVPWASLAAGAGMLLWPLVHADPITNFTLWTSLVFLLDPINLWLGRPSMWRDWSSGWYGRTLAAFGGGLLCGLLWEFWNYWALTKWIYHLPFLGSLEQVRYFEMPVPGLLGFIPFGLECWVMWQTMRIVFDGLVEPLPDERSLL
jgi:hypothetical protein